MSEDKKEAHEAQLEENIKQFGFPTWYEFALDKWGTKWDASNVDVIHQDEEHLTICFETFF